MHRRAALRLAIAFAMSLSWSAAQATVSGKWINPSKSVIIEIEPCGHLMCGTVIAATEKAIKDARKGTPHLVGTRLLTGMKHTSAHVWAGRLFVPDQNMHVTAKLRPEGTTHLKVSGCAMMICKSQIWIKTHHAHV